MLRYFVLIISFFSLLIYVANSNSYASSILAQAAKDTYIDNIKIISGIDLPDGQKILITYVEKDTKPGNGKYLCGGMSNTHALISSQNVVNGLKKLPDEVWDNIELKYLLLCSAAKAGNRSIGGIPVPPIKLLMLSVGTPSNPYKKLSSITLHEFYHMAEMQTGNYKDIKWDQKFSGYNNRYSNQNDTIIGSGGRGFVNQYARSFPYEERAELFAILHTNPRSLSDHIIKTDDQELLEKVKFLREKCSKFLGKDGC